MTLVFIDHEYSYIRTTLAALVWEESSTSVSIQCYFAAFIDIDR